MSTLLNNIELDPKEPCAVSSVIKFLVTAENMSFLRTHVYVKQGGMGDKVRIPKLHAWGFLKSLI